jgi:propionyl-CoA carboxylase alpha chain
MTARRIDLTFGERRAAVELVDSGTGAIARMDAVEVAVSIVRIGDGVFAVTVGGRRAIVHHARAGARHLLHVDGQVYEFQTGGGDETGPAGRHRHQDLAAPMPGIVTRVFVQEGEQVSPGDALFVVEAMKMENVVRAAAAGRVTRIHAAPGAQIDAGAIVVEVEGG